MGPLIKFEVYLTVPNLSARFLRRSTSTSLPALLIFPPPCCSSSQSTMLLITYKCQGGIGTCSFSFPFLLPAGFDSVLLKPIFALFFTLVDDCDFSSSSACLIASSVIESSWKRVINDTGGSTALPLPWEPSSGQPPPSCCKLPTLWKSSSCSEGVGALLLLQLSMYIEEMFFLPRIFQNLKILWPNWPNMLTIAQTSSKPSSFRLEIHPAVLIPNAPPSKPLHHSISNVPLSPDQTLQARNVVHFSGDPSEHHWPYSVHFEMLLTPSGLLSSHKLTRTETRMYCSWLIRFLTFLNTLLIGRDQKLSTAS